MTEQNYPEKELTVEQTNEELVETPVSSEDVAVETEEVAQKDNFFIRAVNYAAKNFDSWKGWVYLLPAILLLLVFTIWPIINTVRIAFLNGYSNALALNGKTFEIGIKNFQKAV